MRILIAASTFPAHENDKAPAFVREQAIFMKKQNPELDISVLAPHYSTETKSYSSNEWFNEYRFNYFWPRKYQKLAGRGIVPAIESNKWFYLQVPFLFIFEFFALFRLVRKVKPDLIYAHWFTPQGVVASLVSSITKTPWVITSHASDVDIWKKIPFGGAIVRHFIPKAQAITAVSKRTLQRMKQFFSDEQWKGISPEVKIIPMGVDTSKFSSPRKDSRELKEEYDLKDKTVILFIGRLARIKGTDYLLKAFAKARKNHDDLHLVIAGDGPIKTELEKLTEELGVHENTTFTGYITGTSKEDYFHLSDMIAVTSITAEDGSREGFPVVIMEALASKKICISTDASGSDVIIEDGINGYIVPEKDVDALTSALEQVKRLNSVEIEKIQDQAIASSLELDWKTIAKQHIDFLFKAKV